MSWLCIEVTVFSFLLLLITSNLPLPSSHAIKYFLFQVMASILFLMSSIILRQHYFVIEIVLLIKLGAAPFHLWLINIADKISFLNLIWVTVIQKIIPLRIILILSWNTSMIYLMILSYTIGILHLVIQTKLINILIASSVYSTPWVVVRLFCYDSLGWIFFLLYCITQITLIQLFLNHPLTPLKPKFLDIDTYSRIRLVLILILAGFPPRPLFFLKLKVLELVLNLLGIYIGFFLLLGRRVVMYNYLNIVMSNFTLGPRKSYF